MIDLIIYNAALLALVVVIFCILVVILLAIAESVRVVREKAKFTPIVFFAHFCMGYFLYDVASFLVLVIRAIG